MSYYEAIEDGIRHEKRGYTTVYFPKCQKCGNEVFSLNYLRDIDYTCKECKLENYLSDKELRVKNNYDLKEKKFKTAVKRLERIDIVMHGKYKDAADKAYENYIMMVGFKALKK